MKRGKISGVGSGHPESGLHTCVPREKDVTVKQRRRATEARERAALVEGGGYSGLARS